MAYDQIANLAVSLIATAPSPATSGTSLVVTAGQGSRFPASGSWNATIWPAGQNPDPSNAEIVRVTARSTDTLTITRAQESTSARTVVVGDYIALATTALTITDVQMKAPVTAQVTGAYTLTNSAVDVPGMSISLTPGNWMVVGTFDMQELGAGDVGQSMTGTIVTTGGTASITYSNAGAITSGTVVNDQVTISQTWYVNVTATTTVKGQAAKSGGSGTSIVQATHTTLMAFYMGKA